MSKPDAQVLLYLNDGQKNTEIYLSEPFNYEECSVREYKENAREALKACCIQALEDHNVHPTRYPSGCANLLGIVERQLDVEATIFISGTTNKNCLEILTLDDITPEPISLDKALDTFEDWVNNLRNSFKNQVENGRILLGEDFSMPDEVPFYTSFEMGLSEEQRKRYGFGPTVGSLNEYEGTIYL